MSEIRGYLQAFDDAWAHAWESLEFVLKGVTEEEAHWQAPAYASEEAEGGWPAPGTIAWQAAHIAHCKRHYTDLIHRVGEKGRPAPRPWTSQPSFAGIVDVLREAHAEQRAAIEGVSDEQLDLLLGNGMPLREFLAMCTRHDTWHAAQIAVARRLARSRA